MITAHFNLKLTKSFTLKVSDNIFHIIWKVFAKLNEKLCLRFTIYAFLAAFNDFVGKK